MPQKFRNTLADWFWLRFCHETVIRISVGAPSSERLACGVAQSDGIWQEALVLCHVSLSVGPLSIPVAWELASPQSK